ncbi:c-type cytochrome [Paenibacillus thermoaerophilus]|uniref:C-type cytochrome n=1 Tax=Paenibacillus thermoaerophilus TaxID=1215385 RepID=A0ABW2V2V2_9BACL|nr:c-type cytochrome [Paenibacillus thermoaerophilus]TMV18685.1 c-type cytochrome [Paenibacillus thermoaerophilus]
MAHGHKSDEKVVYVGDSRVKKRTKPLIPPDYSAYPGKSEAFIPNFLLKEWMVGVVVLVGFLVLVIQEPAPLGYPADPLTPGFIPMPDWYFLFLYQFLKYPYVSGDWVILGTLGVPGIMFGALLLAPFLDTGKERRFYRRPIASALMFLTLISMVHLTIVSWEHYEKGLEEKGVVPEHIKRERERHEQKEAAKAGGGGGEQKTVAIVGKDEPGYEIYQKATCVQCHDANLKGKFGNPSLLGIGDKHDKAQILDIINNGYNGMGAQANALKAKGITDAEIDQLAEWLAKQKKA